MVIKLSLPIFVSIQDRCGIWKTRIQTRLSLWIWAVIAIMLVACTCLFIAHGRYASLLVLTPPLLITGVRLLSVYTITPDSFTLAIRGMKPRHVFPLQNITEIEKEYTKSGKLKSIVIRYRKEGMYHNFLVIKKDDVNIEGILNAICTIILPCLFVKDDH